MDLCCARNPQPQERSFKMKGLAVVCMIIVAAVIWAAFLPLCSAEACSRMFWNNNGKLMLVARNQDINLDDQATFCAFPMGMKGYGGDHNMTNRAEWTSKYASLVVRISSTWVIEGINTEGLGVHGLHLLPTEWEKRDLNRKGVLESRYVQYLLDNAATVADALLLMYQTQLVPERFRDNDWPAHMAIEDVSGDSAVVEFIGGKMKVYHGAEYTVLANEPPFDQQLRNLWRYKYFGGDRPLPGDVDSKSRFVRASAFLSSLNSAFSEGEIKPNLIASMFSAIRSVAVPFGATWFLGETPVGAWPTLWTAVSDLTNKRVYFTHNLARNKYWIDIRRLDFSKGAPLYLKADRPGLAGEVSKLFKPAQ
jgi:penicillin V acylase-like amidase (Ntn superfamily)